MTGVVTVTAAGGVTDAGAGLDPLETAAPATGETCGAIAAEAPRAVGADNARRCCDGPATAGGETWAGVDGAGTETLGAAATGETAESLARTETGGTETGCVDTAGTDAAEVASRLRPGAPASVRAPPERAREGVADVTSGLDPEPGSESEADPAPPEDPPEPRVSANAAGIAATDMPTPSATANAPTRPT